MSSAQESKDGQATYGRREEASPVLSPSPSPAAGAETLAASAAVVAASSSSPPLASSSSTPPQSLSLASPAALVADNRDRRSQPTSSLVDAMLTDLYQITMAYAYWKAARQDEFSVFDLFFRKHPFQGEFTIFAGLEEVLRFAHSYRFSADDIRILRAKFPGWDDAFWVYLGALDCRDVKIYAVDEGSIVIPRIPLIRIEGPLGICQLLETTVLVLVNYASLVATNAARHRLAVGHSKTLLEFGMRKAQGPDGAMSASRYSYLGGFDGTSNVKASVLFGIPVEGTHADAFVVSFCSMNDLLDHSLVDSQGVKRDFVSLVLAHRSALGKNNTNAGELAAFIGYAQAYPNSFLALIDTYDTLESGLWNFICVAWALCDLGFTPKGIRLDSGDLAYLSRECRKAFLRCSNDFHLPAFARLSIVASNDLSEKVLLALQQQGHEIDVFCVGTNLVVCKQQPALGCVFKLVQVNEQPRIKVSQDSVKITIPGRKEAYRLFNAAGEAVLDLLISSGTTPPAPMKRILCRHPFDANKRVYVTPSRVQALHSCWFDGAPTKPFPSLRELRSNVQQGIRQFRSDVGSSRVDLQACKLEYSIVSPK